MKQDLLAVGLGLAIGLGVGWRVWAGGPTDADLGRLRAEAVAANARAQDAQRAYRALALQYNSVRNSVRIVTRRVVVPVPGTPLPPETVFVAGDTTPHVVPGELPNRIRACEVTLESCEIVRLALEASRNMEAERADKAEAWGRKQRAKGRLEGGVVGALGALLAVVVGR